MPNEKPVREQDKFMLRLPDGMRERIADEAKNSGRSMNSEIVARLARSLEETSLVHELNNRVDALEHKMSALWAVHEGQASNTAD